VIVNYDLVFAKIILGRPLRPYLCSQLALTANTIHFQCQTSPRAGKPPILPIFVCYRSTSFLVIKNSDLIFVKILPGRLLTPYLWCQFARTARMAHFQGQTSPTEGKPSILQIFVCNNPRFFW